MNRFSCVLSAIVLFAPRVSQADDAAQTPLTEAFALAQAVDLNPALRAALVQVKDARWNVAGEHARYPWTLSVDAGATRTSSPRLVNGANTVGEVYGVDQTTQLQKRLQFGTELNFSVRSAWQRGFTPTSSFSFIGIAPNGFAPTVSLSARAGFTQPLLRGSGEVVTLAGLNIARSQVTQTGRAAERIASGLVRDVRVAYWEFWYGVEALRIQSQSRDLAIEQRDRAEERVRTGSLAPVDALPFQTRVAAREEDVVTARAEAARQRVALAARMGTLARAADLGAPSEDGPDAPPTPPATLERDALEVSPDLGDLRAAIDSARVQRASAGDANRPRLDASAYVQVDGLGSADAGAALEQLVTFGAVSAHAGLSFDAPLDPGRRHADIGRANMAIELAESRLEERRQQVLSELRTALLREDGARLRADLGERTLALAEKQLDAEKQRFLTGSSTALQVLQAEDELRAAALRVARARVDRLQQALLRDHLAGRLLDQHAALLAPRLATAGAPSSGVFSDAAY